MDREYAIITAFADELAQVAEKYIDLAYEEGFAVGYELRASEDDGSRETEDE